MDAELSPERATPTAATDAPGTTASLTLRVVAVRQEARDVVSIELHAHNGARLPSFSPGAHLELQLPGGLKRHYSLCNPSHETHRYVVAVLRQPAGTGGSLWLHDVLRVGQTLVSSPPKNLFELDEHQPYSVLIAGGIGITPLWCMAQRLEALRRPWRLHYGARNANAAAFLPAIRSLAQHSQHGELHLHLDDEQQGWLDIEAIVRAAPPDAHFYACGPAPMLASFAAATASLSADRVHREFFGAPAPSASSIAGSVAFDVVLARSGRSLHVPADRSLLDMLLEAGVDVPYSCREGVCGSCELRLLAGEADHRDLVLMPSEQESQQVIMACCSRACSPSLTLDC